MGASIDKAALRTLREEVGDEVFGEIVDSFIQSGEELVEAIRTAAVAGDAAAAGRAGHSLKSASALLGGMALSDACAALESAAKAGVTAKEIKMLAARIGRLYVTFTKSLDASVAAG